MKEGPSRQVDVGDSGYEQEQVQEEMEQEQGGEGGGRCQEETADPLDIEDVVNFAMKHNAHPTL